MVKLLVKMGYGGSIKDAGQAIGRSGDEGIDGIIKEDKLGHDVIYIQARRWQGPVGRPEVQKFVGALPGQRTKKGVFIIPAPSAGMMNSMFPLQAGSLCSTYAHQCEESEGRYLLDPIDVYDVGLLAFDEEGKAVPIPRATEWEEQRVIETVKRLKLNEHVPLAEARRKVWQQVDGLVEDFLRAKARCGTGNNPAAQQKLRSVCEQIREKTQSRAELSAVAKWCILFRNDPCLSRLIH